MPNVLRPYKSLKKLYRIGVRKFTNCINNFILLLINSFLRQPANTKHYQWTMLDNRFIRMIRYGFQAQENHILERMAKLHLINPNTIVNECLR